MNLCGALLLWLGSLETRGFDEMELFFELMDVDESGTVSPGEFVAGLKKMKGPALGADVVRLIGLAQKQYWRALGFNRRLTVLNEKADRVQERLFCTKTSRNKAKTERKRSETPCFLGVPGCFLMDFDGFRPRFGSDALRRLNFVGKFSAEELLERYESSERQETALKEAAQRQLVIMEGDEKRRTTYPGASRAAENGHERP